MPMTDEINPLPLGLMAGLGDAKPGSGIAAQQLRMIVAEDDAASRHLLHYFLKKWGFSVHLASDGMEAWNLVQSADVPSIAILDWVMPGLEGVELCRRVRHLARRHYTYMLLLTGKQGKQDIVEGLQAGADDYLTKPFNPGELEARLLVAQRIIAFQESLIAAQEMLRTEALHDFLTRLLNRAGIVEALNLELDRGQRSGDPASILLVDIDHFKHINDTYGHLAGDEALREVARRVKASLRSYDSAGRYGGEEFLIVAPGCGKAAGLVVAEKIRQTVCAAPINFLGQERTITVSVGVSTSRGDLNADSAIRAADAALYQAKGAGRNCCKHASSGLM